MIRKIFKRVRLNFRQTHSERTATQSYRNYKQRIARMTKIIPFFKKANK
jgi:hypothetical protein